MTNKDYKIKDRITCSTQGVVYMLECKCGLQYVGRTSRALHKRSKHIVSPNISDYVIIGGPKGPKFWDFKKVNKHWRGVNFIRQLGRRESFGSMRPRSSLLWV